MSAERYDADFHYEFTNDRSGGVAYLRIPLGYQSMLSRHLQYRIKLCPMLP